MKAQIKIIFLKKIVIYILFMGLCTLICACHDSSIIWSIEAKSPDKHWIAIAHTEQYGGLGTSGVQTTAYLKPVNGSQTRIKILGLTNDSAYPPGITHINIRWETPTHLNVTYNKTHSIVDFQAIKCAGIDIYTQGI